MKRSFPLLSGGLLALFLVGSSASDGYACSRIHAQVPVAEGFTFASADLAPAYLKVIVPFEAVVEIDGVKTKQTGSIRLYVTPDLEKGKKYSYQVKAVFTANGQQVTVERTVNVEAGKEASVDLTKADEPKKIEEPKKKDEPKKVEEPKKKDEPKKEEPKKKDEPKKEEPKKKDEPKKTEGPKKVEPKTEEPKKVEPKKKDEPKKEVKLDVPYVPTPEPVVEAMLKLAKVTDQDVVYDLGCGDGRIVITAVKKYKAKKGLGIELAPERVKLSKDNAKKEGVSDKVEIREGSVLDLKDVADASVVTLYLLPDINLKLMPILKKMKPGSRIVSHDFDMGDWKADKELTVKDADGREHSIYLWTIPGEKKKVEPKKEEPKKEEPKKVESKKEEPKKVEPKPEVKKVEKTEVKKEERTIVVPYVPTPQKVVDAMLKLANVKEGEVVYDLGCGDGRIVVTAVKSFKAKKGYGIDLNPERVKDSNEAAKKANVADKVKFEQGDVLKIADVSEANVVTLYLLPEVNRRLAPMLKKTLKPGSRVVSHDFDMGDWEPEKKIELVDEDGVDHVIYLWTIK